MAGLLVGLFTVAAVSAQSRPVEVIPQAPADSTVTVYYEKLPSGEIRPVSNVPLQKPPTTVKETPNTEPLPQPTFQFRSVPAATVTQQVMPAPQMQMRPVPIQFAPAPTMSAPTITSEQKPAPVTSNSYPPAIRPQQAVTYSYHRLPGGAILPVTAGDTPPMLADVKLVQQSPSPSANRPANPLATEPAADETQRIPTFPPINVPGEQRIETLADYGIETTPPSAQRLFRMESEPQLQQRITEETLKRPVKQGEGAMKSPEFPTYERLSDKPFEERQFGGLIKQIEPYYVCHGRLYLEDLNTERYGWELGVLQPFFSAGKAWADMAFLPYKFMTRPCQRYDCSAGKCFPGDPVPLLLYPPELSATGAGWEASMIYLGFILIP